MGSCAAADWSRRAVWISGALEVDDERSLADKREHDLLLDLERVDVPMDEACRHVEETAFTDLDGV
jgi:hypothetical protein